MRKLFKLFYKSIYTVCNHTNNHDDDENNHRNDNNHNNIAIVIIAIHSRSKLGIRRLYERIELEPIKAKAVIAPVS